MRRALGTGLTLAAAVAAACAEQLTAPTECPDFCPGGEIEVVDTILRDVVVDDSAFRGYIRAHEASVLRLLLVRNVAGIESRAIAVTQPIATTYQFGTDSTLNPIVGVDSVRLQLILDGLDTLPLRNRRLHVYRVPKNIDSATTYADVAPSFSDSLIRSVNLDSLLALPEQEDTVLDADIRRDSVTGDYVRVDTTQRQLILNLKLDPTQVPYVEADSGRLGLGIRVTADSLATVTLRRRFESGLVVSWFVQVDSLQQDTVPRSQVAGTRFDTFVFDPPPPSLDSTLAVGGMPVARSLLRFALPPAIRDSAQIVRATLVLVPDQAPQGVPADSFVVAARRVLSDLGAKAPLAQPFFPGDSSHVGTAWVRIGATDTVGIGVTQMLRLWAADTTLPAAIMLQQSTAPNAIIEGSSLVEIRFRPSSDTASRPALHLTYVPRFRFGVP